jgi:subtilisin family serine protease
MQAIQTSSTTLERLAARLPFALLTAFTACAVLCCATSPAIAAEPSGADSRKVIVRFDADATSKQRSALRNLVDASVVKTLAAPGLQIVTVPRGVSAKDAAARLERSSLVESAEPNRIVARISTLSNDPLFADFQWGLHNTGQVLYDGDPPGTVDADIDAPEAWNTGTGAGIVVAVADTGLAYQHEDIASNVWVNTGESGGGKETNGADDDGNGYVDDYRGYDFVNTDNDPRDDNSHGTHVATTIGSPGDNGVGIAGVNWRARIMPVKIGTAQGQIWDSDQLQGISYAVDNGAKIVNGSYGGQGEETSITALINAHPGVLFVFAAGNDNVNNDVSPSYPCATPSANVICVAATNNQDGRAYFSNYGATTVDLGAPGEDIAAAVPGAGCGGDEWDYEYMSGTSMATPITAGAASLVWGLHPSLTVAQVKNALLSTVNAISGLAGKTVTGGRLNLNAALASVSGSPLAPDLGPFPSQPSSCGINSQPGSGGGGGSTTPPPGYTGGTPTPFDVTVPTMKITHAKKAKIGKGLISFKVRCSENCKITVSARTAIAGMPAISDRVNGATDVDSNVILKFRSKRLKQIKAALRKRSRVKLYIAVFATDPSGNKSALQAFSLNLSR